MKKLTFLFIIVLLSVALTAFISGCAADEIGEDGNIPEEDLRLLRTSGDDLVNEKGEKVFLRAVNAGGLFIQEEWMCATDCVDQLTLVDTLTERFGREGAAELIDVYESAFWTEKDFDNVAGYGFNCIRLPFAYFNLEDETGGITRFERMDRFIDECDERDIYVILDLHGAYGSQNGKDHSGDTSGSRLFGSEENESRTLELWKTVAARYRDRDIIAGYDLLNEPSGNTGYTGVVQWRYYDELYDAVRSADDRHVIIIESVWETSNLPAPSQMGWENVMYSYHNYCWDGVGDAEALKEFTDAKVADYVALEYEVPVFVGEFTCFEEEDAWNYTLSEYEANNVNYAVWTYKVYGEGSSWGIFTGAPTEKADPETDPYEEIARKWAAQDTGNYSPNPLFIRLFKGDTE